MNSLEVVRVLDDDGEKHHICAMCYTKKECPKERKEAFRKDYKARSCPYFTYPRKQPGERWKLY